MYKLFLTLHTRSSPGRCPRRPTKAHSSQRRPTQAYEDETKMKKGPNDASSVVWAIGEFFLTVQFISYPPHPFLARPTPTKAHISQRRPMQAYEDETKMKKGPNDASSVVWAIGELFFECTIYFLSTTPIVGPDDAHEGPHQSTKANAGLRR